MSIQPQTVLERLRVKNYRSLADIDLSLNRLLVLVGANGSGKSTIIDVIRFVRDALTRDLDAAIVDRGGIASIRRWSSRGAPDVSIYIRLRGDDWFGEYGFTIGSEQAGAWRVKSERLHVEQQREFDDFFGPGNVVELQIQEGRLVGEPRGMNSIRALITNISPLISVNGLFLQQLRTFAIAPPFDDFFRFLAGMSFYTIYPDNLREPQKPGSDYPLDERGQNLGSVLRSMRRNSNAQQVLKDTIGRVVEGIKSYDVRQVGGFLVTRLHHEAAQEGRNGPVFDLSQESDGTLRMLGILTALYQDPPRPLLTVEEPELTIHPGALGVLCDILQEASARSQVVITTHSPDLIDRFDPEILRIVEKRDGSTQVGSVNSEQLDVISRHLFSPGELLRIEGLQRADVVKNGR